MRTSAPLEVHTRNGFLIYALRRLGDEREGPLHVVNIAAHRQPARHRGDAGNHGDDQRGGDPATGYRHATMSMSVVIA
jgi:hypothetical protein